VSSISCYAKNDVENADETAELAVLADPTVEKMGPGYENYGALKALCEAGGRECHAEEDHHRPPGYIVGPGDPTDRFTYWPVRFDQGGKILVPGAASDPLQVIDVRDLSGVHAALRREEDDRHLQRVRAQGAPALGRRARSLQEGVERQGHRDEVDLGRKARGAESREAGSMKDVEFPIWAPYAGETRFPHVEQQARGRGRPRVPPDPDDRLRHARMVEDAPADRREKIVRQFDPKKEAELIAALG
jgi:2'-hydroxyisoflavone reductase